MRRLILLNFFRAKAEQLMSDNNRQNAIYAIEEPETSQHPRNQRLLISALQDLAGRVDRHYDAHTDADQNPSSREHPIHPYGAGREQGCP